MVVGVGDKYGVAPGAQGLLLQAGAHPQAGWQ
jgi:hypothetical protein